MSALCVELLRAVREQEFRSQHRGGPAPSVDRAWRAWRADLDRYGPLLLHADAQGLRVSDAEGLRQGEEGPPVGRGRLDDLAARLRERVLLAVRFEPGLDAPTYAAFVSLLVVAPDEVQSHGGAASFLPERGVGIRLMGPDGEPLDEEKPDLLAGPDVADADLADLEEEGGDTTLRFEPSHEESGDVTQRMMPLDPEAPETTAPRFAPLYDVAAEPDGEPDPGPTLSSLLGRRGDDADPDEPYGTRVARLVARALESAEDGDFDASYRTVRELADAASEKSGLDGADRSVALGGLRELCAGRVLIDVIRRATEGEGKEGLRASHVLLQVGEQVSPTLLSVIEAEKDPSRREELVGIAVALGRGTTPFLHRAMEGNSPGRARIAARIAGEIQDDRAVPTLSRLLDHRSAEVRGESARALARIGNVAALTTLKRGLGSEHEDVSSLCAYCLGVTGSDDAAQALTETLRDARRARRTQLAAAVIRSLGRLGREESVPELKRVIDKRSFFRRQELRELKLQAIGALAKLPGTRAQEVLEAIAGGSDMGLAVAARRALKQHEESGASA